MKVEWNQYGLGYNIWRHNSNSLSLIALLTLLALLVVLVSIVKRLSLVLLEYTGNLKKRSLAHWLTFWQLKSKGKKFAKIGSLTSHPACIYSQILFVWLAATPGSTAQPKETESCAVTCNQPANLQPTCNLQHYLYLYLSNSSCATLPYQLG